MRYWTLIFLLFTFGLSHAQQTKGLKPRVSKNDSQIGTKRAVIVGVSDYQNDQIPDLQYAHVDAEKFSEYLLTDPGGITSKEDIILLLNDEATSGNFVSALYWLLEETKENDEVVIYFSGHGDVESSIMNQPGFLLCWDAPAKVYMGGGTFGLAYLKEIVATLSSQNQAKVTVITDACRSGNLAGNENGAQTTASYLAQQFANEVKIMSCQPNELALEGQEWGGGRGVFSYYLVKGLKGAADKNLNKTVSLKELQRYLEDYVSEQVQPHEQNPLTVGDRNATISNVDPNYQPEEENQEELTNVSSRSITEWISQKSDTTFTKLIAKYNEAIVSKNLLYPTDISAWHYLMQLRTFEDFASINGLYTRNLAALLQDEAQQSINAYLAGSTAELQKRWVFDPSYDHYPEYLEKAAELLGSTHFFYQNLRARSFYFKGLQLRLKGERDFDTVLIKQSIYLQDSCLAYDEFAAHALNEIGYAHHLIGKDSIAIEYFNRATEITPQWPLVNSNLCRSWVELGDFDKALAAGQKAFEADSTFLLAYQNLSVVYYNLNQPEQEKYYLNKAYEIDSTFWPILDHIGLKAYNNADYSLAEKYWTKSYEANPTSVFINNNLGHLYLKLDQLNKSKSAFLRIRETRPNAIEAYQGMIEYYFYTGDLVNAKAELFAYLKEYQSDGFAYYLLASIQASDKESEESLKSLKSAFKNGFDQYEVLDSDPNFNALKEGKEYQDLLNQFKKD